MGDYSIISFNKEKASLRHEIHYSEKKSFFAFWNTYIDGRLNRLGINVHSFDKRLEELVGTYKFKIQRDESFINEYDSPLRRIWESERTTSSELFLLSRKYPYKRTHP